VGAGAAGSSIGTVGANGIQDIGVDNVSELGSTTDALGTAPGGLSFGNALGALGAAYGVYNFVNNWQSGATGSDAMNGAAAGAAIGSIVPVVGTAFGALIGGAVGAISSAFGPGKTDPETLGWQGLVNQDQKTPGLGLTTQNPFLLLAGMFDEKSSSVPIYQQFGRMGENKFTVAMTQQINSALANGAISKTTSPADVYDKVVLPWVSAMGNWNAVGSQYKQSLSELMLNMTSQYMGGQYTNWKAVGGDYNFGSSIVPFGGTAATSAPKTGGAAVNVGISRALNKY
jgi:hypothetical protein